MIKSILKKLVYVYWIFLLMLVAFELSPKALQYNKVNPWLNDTNRPFIIPHGGAKALYPENTIMAFKETSQYDVFEVDLTLTKDNILISHHNLDLGHDLLIDTPTADLIIRNLNYQEVIDKIKLEDYPFSRAFENVDGIKPYATTNDPSILDLLLPQTLESLFQTYPNKMYILELKDLKKDEEDTFTLAANELLALIETHDMTNKVMVSSFDDAVIRYFKKISNNKIHTSSATGETLNFVLTSAFSLDFFYRPSDAALAMPIEQRLSASQVKLISILPKRISGRIMKKEGDIYYTDLIQQTIIKDLKRHNMASIYWTVNDAVTMERLIKLNVDGIITDRPDLLEQVLISLGR